MNVRSDVEYGNLSPEEKTIVRMWFVLGLDVQAVYPPFTTNWTTLLRDAISRGHPSDNLHYRLKP